MSRQQERNLKDFVLQSAETSMNIAAVIGNVRLKNGDAVLFGFLNERLSILPSVYSSIPRTTTEGKDPYD